MVASPSTGSHLHPPKLVYTTIWSDKGHFAARNRVFLDHVRRFYQVLFVIITMEKGTRRCLIYLFCLIIIMEAGVGIEPASTALQAAA